MTPVTFRLDICPSLGVASVVWHAERDILEHAVRAVTEPTYASRVVKVAVILVCLGVLAPACGEPEPTVVYHFEVRGTGDNVQIAFLTEEAGLVETSATLPWASEEFRGTEESVVRIEANGPAGSRVKCVVRYRRIHGAYGGSGSGASAQWANRPDEDQSVCALGQQSLTGEG